MSAAFQRQEILDLVRQYTENLAGTHNVHAVQSAYLERYGDRHPQTVNSEDFAALATSATRESRRLAAKMTAMTLEATLVNATAAGLVMTVGESGVFYLWDSDDWNAETGLPVSLTTRALARLENKNGVWDATWDRS